MVSNMPSRERFAWWQLSYPAELRVPTEEERCVAKNLRVHLVEHVKLARAGKLHIFKKVLNPAEDRATYPSAKRSRP